MNEELELEFSLRRCTEIFSSGILSSNSQFAQSAFIELLIRLNDLLQYLNKKGKRIIFKDDIESKDVYDITDLISKLRNAACHERTSGESNFNGNRFVFNRIIGRCVAIKAADFEISSKYHDDITFFYGDRRLLLNRHVAKLLNEISSKIKI